MKWLILLVMFVPSVSCQDIPALLVNGETHFVAAFYTSDSAAIIGQGSEFSPLFGDSGTVTTENTVVVQAPFDYNVTALRVSATQANCGDLLSGETVVVTLRINGIDSALSTTCSNGAAANSAT